MNFMILCNSHDPSNTPFQPAIGFEILFIKQFEFMIFPRWFHGKDLNGDNSFAHTRRKTYNIVFDCHRYIDDISKQIYLICLGIASRFYTKYAQLHTDTNSKQISSIVQNLLTYSPRIRQLA